MHQCILVAVLAWLVYGPTSAHAQGMLYKWVDSRGVVHYTNTPTNAKAKSVDDTLPPAANFKSPAPPAETAKASAKEAPKTTSGNSTDPANTPNEDTPEQEGNGSTPAAAPSASDTQ